MARKLMDRFCGCRVDQQAIVPGSLNVISLKPHNPLQSRGPSPRLAVAKTSDATRLEDG
jgi:hypothetical protein